MELLAFLIGLVLLVAYIAIAVYVTRLTRRSLALKAMWLRELCGAIVLALFFAPGVIAEGQGAAIGPAWLAVLDPESNERIVRVALVSLVASCAMFFVGGVVIHRIRKHPTN